MIDCEICFHCYKEFHFWLLTYHDYSLLVNLQDSHLTHCPQLILELSLLMAWNDAVACVKVLLCGDI